MSATLGNATLYVGDLAPNVTEALLHDLFSKIGPVLSTRICRDTLSKSSLGYGYVNYHQPGDATRARETLNYHMLNGRAIRIMWCQKDPQLRKQGRGNMIIKNLAPSIDNQTLFDTFSQFGTILSCKVETDKSTGTSKGYGFVHFESEESAKVAIEKVNGMMIASQQVEVQAFIPRSERIAHSRSQFTSVEVLNVKQGVTEAEVLTYFAQFGTIKRVKLFVGKTEELSVFVDFEDHAAAAKAVEQGTGDTPSELCATKEDAPVPLEVKRSLTKAERKDEQLLRRSLRFAQQAENSAGGLYVGNLADEVDDTMLSELFQKFGTLVRAQVMMSKFGAQKSRGFGFVCFDTAEAAETARQQMNNFELLGRPLMVNKAQHRSAQKKQSQGWSAHAQYSGYQGLQQYPFQQFPWYDQTTMPFYPYAQPYSQPYFGNGQQQSFR
eukprot:NODE_1435_length_1504_cov_79.570806_g1360_i0.p1 GENE.NODE_1435_length_1504_cov_79.570806_g1360_i0~~NODE_1435_length_1504_cov_79.570806_g1360_i0.p1  ORF type:complete len:459 (-),score=140.81 NODE_1435_length_1504_cov_79.570806_g1360_i0:128-1441(-)